MKILMLILSMVVIGLQASAEESPCTRADAIAAEISIPKLRTWEDVYESFKRYRHCDDGAIAEGYSDLVVRMLAHRWYELERLITLTSSDHDFYKFVMQHIDSTADKTDIEKIVINSSKHCPKAASNLCLSIEKVAKNALREFNE